MLLAISDLMVALTVAMSTALLQRQVECMLTYKCSIETQKEMVGLALLTESSAKLMQSISVEHKCAHLKHSH